MNPFEKDWNQPDPNKSKLEEPSASVTVHECLGERELVVPRRAGTPIQSSFAGRGLIEPDPNPLPANGIISTSGYRCKTCAGWVLGENVMKEGAENKWQCGICRVADAVASCCEVTVAPDGAVTSISPLRHIEDFKVVLNARVNDEAVRDMIEKYSSQLHRTMYANGGWPTFTNTQPITAQSIEETVETGKKLREQQKQLDMHFRSLLRRHMESFDPVEPLSVWAGRFGCSYGNLHWIMSDDARIPGWFYDRAHAYFNQLKEKPNAG